MTKLIPPEKAAPATLLNDPGLFDGLCFVQEGIAVSEVNTLCKGLAQGEIAIGSHLFSVEQFQQFRKYGVTSI